MRSFFCRCRVFGASLLLSCYATAAENAADQARKDARKYTDSGDYAKALERHQWYHQNALAIDLAQKGVRLSFALGDCLKLAEKYPPALEALKRTRDDGTKDLEAGTAPAELFNDVLAINIELRDSVATIVLFKFLDASHPELARACFRFADTALVEAREIDLFLRYAGDLRVYLRDKVQSHNELMSDLKYCRNIPAAAIEQFDQRLFVLTDFLAGLAIDQGNSGLAAELASFTSTAVAERRFAK